MAQNVYDQEQFFNEYCKLPRSEKGLEGAEEWPTLRGLLGGLHDDRILDLGCGFGWFCRWARENGARQVRGIDISQNMLTRARAATASDSAITYEVGDLDTVSLPNVPSYELVYSSLAFHYLSDLSSLFEKIYECLVPNGRFVFSVEHPIFTAPLTPSWDRDDNADGPKSWMLNSYAEEGPRVRDWLAKGVRKQHRTIDTYVSLLLKTGFVITALKEWMPTREYIEAHPEWVGERSRPLFLLLAAQVPATKIGREN